MKTLTTCFSRAIGLQEVEKSIDLGGNLRYISSVQPLSHSCLAAANLDKAENKFVVIESGNIAAEEKAAIFICYAER